MRQVQKKGTVRSDHAKQTNQPSRTLTAVAILHREEIIDRVAHGEYLASIAHSLGLKGKGQALSNALSKDPDYNAARELGLEAKLANREAIVESAAPADVPRARELLGHARWRAERECPARWGSKQEITHHGQQPALQVTIVQAAQLPSNNMPAIENKASE